MRSVVDLLLSDKMAGRYSHFNYIFSRIEGDYYLVAAGPVRRREDINLPYFNLTRKPYTSGECTQLVLLGSRVKRTETISLREV